MNEQRYSPVAIGLHWLVGMMILISFSVGSYMTELALSPTKLQLYSWHKWAGVTIFGLVLVRVLWRLTHPVPPFPQAMPRWQRVAATSAHYSLYGLMIAIPLTGWLMSSAKGFQTVYFGILPIPDFLEKSKGLGETLALVHKTLNFTMMAIVVVHVAGALKHHFVDKDAILRRMLPARKK